MIISNCCGAPIWQPDPITGHGHCRECGEHCTPEKEEDMRKTKTFAIRLSEAEHAAVKAAADRSGRSMSRFFVVAALRWAEIERANADLNQLQTPADAGQNRKG